MELRELRLRNLPGLPEPFTIAGRPGLNLILGPNGSGKTSLARAALGLLWPDEGNAGHLSAVWQQGEAVWHASRAGGPLVLWQRDGQAHEPPLMPPADQAASFRLGLLDLLKLAADQSDTGLARAIRNQMAGGYDLAALLADARITGREGQAPAIALKAAEQRVAELWRKQRDLQKDEAALADLQQQVRAAKAAIQRAEALRLAKSAVETTAAAATASSRLSADFPGVMNRLRENDADELGRWRARERTLAEDRAQTNRDLDRAEQQLAAAGFPDGGPVSTVLDAAHKRIEQAHRQADDLQRARSDEAAAEASLARARASLAPWGQPDPDQAVDREALRKTARDVQSLLEANAARHGLDRLLASPALQAPDAPAAAETLAAGRRTLLSWLAAGDERRWPWVPLAAGLVLLGLGVAARPWSPGDDGLMGWLALAAGASTLVAGSLPRLLANRSRSARFTYGETGLPDPTSWTESGVRELLAVLADRDIEDRFARLRQRLREELIPLRDQAARAAGDDEPGERLEVAEWLHRNAAYCEALSVREQAAARCVALNNALAQTAAAVRRDLSAWLDVPAVDPARDGDDLAALEAAIDDLSRRCKAHDDALAARNEAERRLADQNKHASETAAEIASLLQRLDLDPHPDSDTKVRAYAARLRSYREQKVAADRLATEEQIGMESLERLASPWRQAAREALAWPPQRIASELDAAEAEAATHQAVREQIVAIQTRCTQAQHDTALDEALVARDRASDVLAAVRDEVRAVALRRLLLQRLQQQHRRRSEPPVLHRARALFGRFTAGRYELLVDDRDDESFRARDTVSGEGLSLGQLSDGTRAQLLLAARLAYVHEVERGVKVPLFFDESLTASDPQRFAAIGGAVLDLVADEGRQVFYLTCDPADVEAWQRLLAERGQPPATVIDLAAVRGLAAAAPIERLRVAAREPVPEPLPGEDPADYAARLSDVPPLDIFAPATVAHLFHLLRDDLSLLHAMLARRVTRIGQIEPMASALQAADVVAPAQLDELRAKVRALGVFLEAASVGRGRPVPPGAMTAERVSSTSKLPEIEDLLLSPPIKGDAARLLEALERGAISHLRQTVQADLAEWLAREGYLDLRPPLARDEVRARVLQEAASDIEAGRVSLAAVEELLEGWWRGVRGDGS